MMTQLPISMAGLMTLLLVLFQDSACSHFFCALPIAASPLSARLDVLILALLFFAYATYSSLFRHGRLDATAGIAKCLQSTEPDLVSCISRLDPYRPKRQSMKCCSSFCKNPYAVFRDERV